MPAALSPGNASAPASVAKPRKKSKLKWWLIGGGVLFLLLIGAAVALNPGIIDTEMLRSCFGSGSSHYPSPAQWVKSAGPFLLGLTAKANGRALTVPGTD